MNYTRMTGGINIVLILTILFIGSAVGLAYLGVQWSAQKDRIAALEQMRKVSSSDGILQDALTFEFATVKTDLVFRHEKTYDKPSGGVGLLNDKIDIIYKAEYTFTFGYDLQSWAWCPKVLSEQEGIIQVNTPPIVWTNTNLSPSLQVVAALDGIYYTDLTDDIAADTAIIITEKIKEKAANYLQDPKMRKSIETALQGFLINTMNDAHPNSNPVSKVVLNYSAECS